MSETIHDAVRATLDAIKVQHGGSLPDGLEIRHTSVFVGNSAPYNIGLWCHRCQEYVRQWCMSDEELKALPGLVSVLVDYHACWQPKSAGCAGTEGTETPKVSGGGTITLEWKTDPETTARWAEWLAAGLGKPMRADAGPFSPLDYNIGFTPSSDRVWLTCNREQCEGIPPFGRTESGANFRALVEAAKLHHAACHGGRS